MAVGYYFGTVELVSGQGFRATRPDVPGFSPLGNSVDEVKRLAEFQFTSFLAKMSAQGKEVPLPQTDLYSSPYQSADEFRILVAGDVLRRDTRAVDFEERTTPS